MVRSGWKESGARMFRLRVRYAAAAMAALCAAAPLAAQTKIRVDVNLVHAVATVNGTAALHIALLLAGVERDDEVLVSTLTFVAPANAVRYVGAWPVFIDAEPEYWQWDNSLVRRFLEGECERVNGELRNRRSGRRVKALLPVHVLGHPVDIEPLMALSREFGLTVIEDATEKESPLVLAVQSTFTPLRGLPYWSAATTVRGAPRGPAALPTWLLPLETASEATAAGAPVAEKVYDRLVPLTVATTVLAPGVVPSVSALVAMPPLERL